jgi:hypothetical protein
MKYAYAVMDGNEPPDMYRFACSCHHSLEAAQAACRKLNSGPNDHYYVAHWGAGRWDRERPNDNHYVDREIQP